VGNRTGKKGPSKMFVLFRRSLSFLNFDTEVMGPGHGARFQPVEKLWVSVHKPRQLDMKNFEHLGI